VLSFSVYWKKIFPTKVKKGSKSLTHTLGFFFSLLYFFLYNLVIKCIYQQYHTQFNSQLLYAENLYSSFLHELLAACSLGSCFPRLPISCLPKLSLRTGSDIHDSLHMSPCCLLGFNLHFQHPLQVMCLAGYTMENFARLVSPSRGSGAKASAASNHCNFLSPIFLGLWDAHSVC